MPVYTVAEYRVNAKAVDKVKKAVKELVRSVKANEPRTGSIAAEQAEAARTAVLDIPQRRTTHPLFSESILPIINEDRLCSGTVIFGDENQSRCRTVKGDETMINPLSISAAPGMIPKTEMDPVKVRTEVKAEKMQGSSAELPDSVQLSRPAQARALRQAGQSIPQIAIKLGLAIPTVAAFFEE